MVAFLTCLVFFSLFIFFKKAVSAAMQCLLKEYLIVVAQLETQFGKAELSLQSLWFYLQPCMRTLEILCNLVKEICPMDGVSLRGGALLSLLHTHAMNQLGDSKAQELCFHLTQAVRLFINNTLSDFNFGTMDKTNQKILSVPSFILFFWWWLG